MRKVLTVFFAGLVLAPLPARAQKPITQTESTELTAKIEAIDHDARMVTLRDKDGNWDTLYAGPEVKRFDELKVGDSVTFRYHESLVYRIRKPGEPAADPGSDSPTVVRGQGARPSATATRQRTVTVAVKSVDPKVPSVTVVTEDGRTSSYKVEDRKYVKGLKAGDKVEITYTEAVLISVK
jgi:Cu/Ag efflux protein CusF